MTFVMSAGLTQIEIAIEQGQGHAGERYALSQTCFRHFDQEKIGTSPVHLSLFRMCGAIHFGATSRKDTIKKIWGFLTDDLGLDKEQLRVTCFAGGESDGHKFEKDSEAIQTWQALGLSPAQIVNVGIDGGFWKQGGGISGRERFRKCGPSTELFFDRGPEWRCGGACQAGCQCGRYIEVANVLSIHSQIDLTTQSLAPLANPFDEAVIGVERLAMVLQAQSSVFGIECLAPLVKLAQAYQTSSLGLEKVGSEWVIADHIRALLFLAADGAPPPGKGGRAGIIRKLIRAILTQQKRLGISQNDFIPSLIGATFDLYKNQHPNLKEGQERLLTFFATESDCFEQTLSRGYRKLDRLVQRSGNGSISEQQVIDLVKNSGVPLSLLEIELAQRSIKLYSSVKHSSVKHSSVRHSSVKHSSVIQSSVR